jgi:putative ABC transport system ATP-binding protein
MTPALSLTAVGKEYPGTPPVHALRSVTLSIQPGEFVAVVGPSGSGKSTLLSVAGTLERPSTVRVEVAGSAVEHLSDGELSTVRAHGIGFVFQQFFLVPHLSALDNAACGLLYRGVPRAARRHAARAALDEVGLGHRADHWPTQLSGGECQRTAIARALVGRPAVILADEPTGNVDSTQGTEILDLLFEINARGTTIVVVTHNPEVSDALPRVVRLRDGVIEADDGPA